MKAEKLYTRNLEDKKFIVQIELETIFFSITYMVSPRDIEDIFPISTGNEPEKAIFIRAALET